MSSVPTKTLVYAASLAVVTTCVLGRALAIDGVDPASEHAVTAVVLLTMIVVAERFHIVFPHQSVHFSVSVSAVLLLGAAYTFKPSEAALLAVVATVAVDIGNRLRPIQVLVNASNFGLAVYVAAIAYRRLNGDAGGPIDNLQALAATVLASVLYTVVNLGLLSVIVAPVVGETPYEVWRANFSGTYVFVSLPLLGCLVPIIADQNKFGVLILAIPLAGSHLALRALRRVELETQATIVSLTDALEFRDAYTHHHSARVTEYVELILGQMPHLPSQVRHTTVEAARIHDVGKVGIRDTALLKAGPLTDDERLEIQRHSAIGADIVGQLGMYRQGAAIVRHHHERWDGRGYPDGLAGEDIPLGARIIAVADAFDAMMSDRPYRRALSFKTAVAEIARNSGTQFDPQIVEAFQRAMVNAAGQVTVERVAAATAAD